MELPFKKKLLKFSKDKVASTIKRKMSEDHTLDAQQETRLVVLQLKVERLEEKQEELRERLKAVEKWVIGAAAVLTAGVTLIGFATNISKAYL